MYCRNSTAQSAQERNKDAHARISTRPLGTDGAAPHPNATDASLCWGLSHERKTAYGSANSAETPKQPTDGLLCVCGTFRTQPRPFHNP